MTSPILILDVEGGTTTLRSRDVDVVQVRSTVQVKEIHDKLSSENDGYYKTVIIDSLTELQKLDMRDIMKELLQRRPDRDPDVPDVREWGKSSEHIRRIVRFYRDLEMNTIFTALEQSERDETGLVTFEPSLPGKLRGDVPGFIDIVGYLHTKTEDDKIKRIIQFTQTRKIIAKDRTNALGSHMENPSIPDMWNLIHPKEKK
jgi:AAA domain